MRPGQGNRRNRRTGHGGGGHQGGYQGQSSSPSRQPRNAVSLRNQIFDSNGPDTRVRGNAFQVHEKYLALAKDALSSGDRVLAENYLQHAEHYYRIVEAINEQAAAEQRSRPQAYAEQPQPPLPGNGFYGNMGDAPQQQSPAPLGMRPQENLGNNAPQGMMEEDEEGDAMPSGPGSMAAMGRR